MTFVNALVKTASGGRPAPAAWRDKMRSPRGGFLWSAIVQRRVGPNNSAYTTVVSPNGTIPILKVPGNLSAKDINFPSPDRVGDKLAFLRLFCKGEKTWGGIGILTDNGAYLRPSHYIFDLTGKRLIGLVFFNNLSVKTDCFFLKLDRFGGEPKAYNYDGEPVSLPGKADVLRKTANGSEMILLSVSSPELGEASFLDSHVLEGLAGKLETERQMYAGAAIGMFEMCFGLDGVLYGADYLIRANVNGYLASAHSLALAETPFPFSFPVPERQGEQRESALAASPWRDRARTLFDFIAIHQPEAAPHLLLQGWPEDGLGDLADFILTDLGDRSLVGILKNIEGEMKKKIFGAVVELLSTRGVFPEFLEYLRSERAEPVLAAELALTARDNPQTRLWALQNMSREDFIASFNETMWGETIRQLNDADLGAVLRKAEEEGSLILVLRQIEGQWEQRNGIVEQLVRGDFAAYPTGQELKTIPNYAAAFTKILAEKVLESCGPKLRSGQRMVLSEEEARAVLGFGAGVRLTLEQIRRRQRLLAAIFHPDRPDRVEKTEEGAATDTLKLINSAVVLLEKVI